MRSKAIGAGARQIKGAVSSRPLASDQADRQRCFRVGSRTQIRYGIERRSGSGPAMSSPESDTSGAFGHAVSPLNH